MAKSEKTDYRQTLQLPRTDFPMRAQLYINEPKILSRWQEMGLYNKIRSFCKGKPKYILHDGPPYANGHIHLGHVLNKTLKDMVVKFKSMQGFDSPFIPGWDCHGLPVEHQLFKELKITKYDIDQVSFREKAHNYALKFVDIQKDEFKRLGIFADWQNPYLTIDKSYESVIISSFAKLSRQGYVYRGLKPVNWCFFDETALAEAEVEYATHTSDSIFVKFNLLAAKDIPANTCLLVWTTTPWTLLANVAVAAHPDLEYGYFRTDQGNLILLERAAEKLAAEGKLTGLKLLKKIPAAQLNGLLYEHPLNLRKGKVVLADYVSEEEGSGLVHIAPGHGAEDFALGKKYSLEVIMPVDEKGRFDSTAGEFQGMRVFDASKKIIERLNERGLLLSHSPYAHSYPFCWRCKNPVIFRATKQWFLNIDHEGLRQKLLQVISKDVKWVPDSGKERISSMVSLRPDWCLSRQRYWGVPIPAIKCTRCGEETLFVSVMERLAEVTLSEGSGAWFKHDLKTFINDEICPECKSRDFQRGKDILDVWFDSGVSSQAVLKQNNSLSYPADLYLEGSDQHRGWFQSSLIPGVGIDNSAPYKSVLTHGFVVDAEGKKMSKSLGNVISPEEIIKDFGADVLRLWVASSDYREDVRVSKEILSRLSEAYRKIRNTCRFILSNLYDFNPDIDSVDRSEFLEIDKWILLRAEQTRANVTELFERFEFYKAFKEIYDFCNEDLSMNYLDMVKGRLYTFAADSKERRACQTAQFKVINILVRLFAPTLSFTADEIWQYLPKGKDVAAIESVHLASWPLKDPLAAEDCVKEGLFLLMRALSVCSRLLEEERSRKTIGSSFDAKINILTNDESYYKQLNALDGQIPEILRVSQVEVMISQAGFPDNASTVEGIPEIAISVQKAAGQKCPRCWNYHPGTEEEVCSRCIRMLKKGVSTGEKTS